MVMGGAASAGGTSASLPKNVAGALGRFGVDGHRLVYAVNVALITALALGLSFLLDIQRSYWCLLTVALVAQASSGLTVWRSVARTLGTFAGCGFGLCVVALFAQDSATTLICLGLWLFAVGFLARFEVGLDAYAYSTAGLTALVIVIDTGPSADLAYGLALARTTETLIGIFAAFAVLLVVFPVSASRTLLEGLGTARGGVMKLARHAVAPAEAIDVNDTQAVARALSATYANLRAQRLERSHRRVSAEKAEQAVDRLNRLLIHCGRLSFALAGLGAPARLAIGPAAAELRRLVEAVPPPDAGASALAGAAASFRAFVEGLDLGPAIERLDAEPDRAASRELVASNAIRRFATAMAAFLDAEAAIHDPNAPVPAIRPMRARYPDWEAAFMRGLRPALVFACLSAVWLASASSSFQTLALIGAGMTATLPAIAPRAVLLIAGKVIGLGMAAMFLPVLALEMTLPYVETFLVYALLVGMTMGVFYYICYDPLLKTYGLGGAIFLAVTLQPANNSTFDALPVFNAAATLFFLPLAVGSAFAVIFPENAGWLRWRLAAAADALLKRAAAGADDHDGEFVAQALDAIGDYGGDLDLGDPANRRPIARAHAVAAVGTELYDLARLQRLAHLPADLGALLPGIRAALLREAGAGPRLENEEKSAPALAQARDAGYRAYAASDRPELARQAALRFALGLEFLQLVTEDGALRAKG